MRSQNQHIFAINPANSLRVVVCMVDTVVQVLARILDGSRLDEFKPLYGNTLVTGALMSPPLALLVR